MRNTRIYVLAEFFVLVALLLLFVPLEWIISWIAAVFVHELSHYIALRALGVDVYSITIGITGAIMTTEPLNLKTELICALAGPAGGACLLVIGRWFPYIALFGAIQSAYNLLPVFPLDGGRVLRCCLEYYCYDRANQICNITKWLVLCMLLVIIVFFFSCQPVLIIAVLSLLLEEKR